MTEVETDICYGLGYPAFNQRTVSGLRRIVGVFVWSPFCEIGPNQGFCRPLSVRDPAALPPPLGPKSCSPHPPSPSGPKKMPKYLVLKGKKFFSGAFGAGKYPYPPIFSFLLHFKVTIFEKSLKLSKTTP